MEKEKLGMNTKLAKFSDKELEERLMKMQKFQKVLNGAIIGTIVLIVLSLLLELSLGSSFSILALALVLKYVIYPSQMGLIKTELNNRSIMKQNQSVNQEMN